MMRTDTQHPQEWTDHEIALFNEALELTTREEQADFLVARCGSDHEQRRRLERLLEAARVMPGDFMMRIPGASDAILKDI